MTENTMLAHAQSHARAARPASMRANHHHVAWLEPDPAHPERDVFCFLAATNDAAWGNFEGQTHADGDMQVGRGPCSTQNAALLRDAFPNLKPVPLGLATSAGFGDRLGVATPGHVRALRTADPEGHIQPIFAQQSIREMTRTGRTPQGVMDDATWGAFAAGWHDAVGADADHLKTEADVLSCVDAGFTFFTFDPGDRVDDDAETASETELETKLAELPWGELQTNQDELLATYVGTILTLDGLTVELDRASVVKAAAKYGAALAHAAHLHTVLVSTGAPFEIEISVDETGTPTSLHEHAFLALELKRLGVPFVSLAPRFVGRFEKGVDFRGNLNELTDTLRGHALIARELGPYKLSLHSGSDKFSVYPHIAEATQGLVHLKTAGTSYLEALRVAARHDPDLFRKVLTLGHERFEQDRASYLIGAELSRVPNESDLRDDELPALLDDDDARQVLHVTYGSALDAFHEGLMTVLAGHREDHEATLEAHFVRHLKPFAAHASDRP